MFQLIIAYRRIAWIASNSFSSVASSSTIALFKASSIRILTSVIYNYVSFFFLGPLNKMSKHFDLLMLYFSVNFTLFLQKV